MTLAKDMLDVVENKLITESDLYNNFDLDIGVLEKPTFETKIPLLHYEVSPYSRTVSQVGFIIKNNESTQSIIQLFGTQRTPNGHYVNKTMSTASINGYNFSMSATPTDEARIGLLLGRSKNSTNGFFCFASESEISTYLSNLKVTNYNRVLSDLNYTSAGLYFVVDEIIPNGEIWNYNYDYKEDKTKEQWINKYNNGYVLCHAVFASITKIPSKLIAENETSYNESEYLGYLTNNKEIFLKSKNNISITLAENVGYYVETHEEEKTYVCFNCIGSGSEFSVDAGWRYQCIQGIYGSNYPLMLIAVPFANSAERDFALGISEKSEFISSAEFGDISKEVDTNE